jgi:hypothetical protein
MSRFRLLDSSRESIAARTVQRCWRRHVLSVALAVALKKCARHLPALRTLQRRIRLSVTATIERRRIAAAAASALEAQKAENDKALLLLYNVNASVIQRGFRCSTARLTALILRQKTGSFAQSTSLLPNVRNI